MKVTAQLLIITVILASIGCLQAQDAASLLTQAETNLAGGKIDRA